MGRDRGDVMAATAVTSYGSHMTVMHNVTCVLPTVMMPAAK